MNITTASTASALSSEEAAYVNFINRIISQMSFYFAITILPVGILCDLFSLYIYTRPNLNKTNMGFLYLFQTLVDLLLMLHVMLLNRSRDLYGVTLTNVNEILCRLITFSRRYTVQISSWMNVVTCFDRFMFVYFASRARFMNKKLNLFLIISVTFAILMVINMHNFFYFLTPIRSTGPNQTTIITGYSCTGHPTLMALGSYYSVFIRTLIPFSLMATMNILIIRRLNSNKRKVNAASLNVPQLAKKEQVFTRVVLSLNAIFFLFNGPFAITVCIDLMQGYFIKFPVTTDATLNLISSAALNFSLSYQAVYCFINFMFNKVFKSEVLRVLRLKRDDHPKSLNNQTSVTQK
jgi:hypothetical protein